MAKPRCQKVIPSLSFMRPGFLPQQTSPNSAWTSLAAEHTVANQGVKSAAFRALLLIVDHELVTGRGAIGVRSRQTRDLPDQAR